MKYIVYISTTSKILTDSELADMLRENYLHNRRANINGMLIYTEGSFIQVLEGPEESLSRTYQEIVQDKRHKNIIKLAEDKINVPNFSSWSMAFKAADPSKLEALEGYVNPVSSNFLRNASNHAALMLLKSFAKDNRITYNL
jgi:hypothetical protein